MNAITDLVVRVQGAVTESNFDAYKEQLIIQIKSANKELKTDDDFVEAEATVKQFQTAEKALIQAKSDALEQAAEVQRMFEAIDEITEEARQARLGLQRQIKQQKELIKGQLVQKYVDDISDYYDQLAESCLIFDHVRPHPFTSYDELLGCVKGLKTVKSMEQKLSDKAAELKQQLDNLKAHYYANQLTLDRIEKAHKPLFQDTKYLLTTDSELLKAVIEKRIATYEAEELKRQQAEEAAKAEAQQPDTKKDNPDRPPAADAQGIEREPDPTGGGGQHNQTESEPFLLKVQIVTTKEQVIQFAQNLEKQFESDSRVRDLKLARGLID